MTGSRRVTSGQPRASMSRDRNRRTWSAAACRSPSPARLMLARCSRWVTCASARDQSALHPKHGADPVSRWLVVERSRAEAFPESSAGDEGPRAEHLRVDRVSSHRRAFLMGEVVACQVAWSWMVMA